MRISALSLTLALVLPACNGGGSSGDDDAADGGSGDGGSGDAEGDGDGGSTGEDGADSSTGGGGPAPVLPDVDAATFAGDPIDNPYHPLPVGATWVHQAMTDEGLEEITVEVTADTREVQGVTATVVRDTVTLDGVVIEDTYDWYAQDTAGNVWYLGEDTCEFEGGVCVDMVGAWEWGVDGALPGIIMPADPAVEDEPRYLEYYVGEAEDAAQILEVGLSVTVEAGTFEDCIRTHETSTLDLTLDEYKTYCPGVGVVLVEEDDLDEELVMYDLP